MDDKTRRHIAMINGILTEAPKIRILFISPVATEPEVVRELLRCEAGIPEFICKTEYMPEITRAVGKFSGVRLFITSGARSWEDVMRQVSKCDRPDLVVIDHPELIQITPATPDNNHKEEGHHEHLPGRVAEETETAGNRAEIGPSDNEIADLSCDSNSIDASVALSASTAERMKITPEMSALQRFEARYGRK